MKNTKILYIYPETLDTHRGTFVSSCGQAYNEMPKDDALDTETEVDYDFPHMQNYFIPIYKRGRMSEWNFTINLN